MRQAATSQFYAMVGSDVELARRFVLVTDGKHSAEAIAAIAAFAREIGFELSFEDIRTVRSQRPSPFI